MSAGRRPADEWDYVLEQRRKIAELNREAIESIGAYIRRLKGRANERILSTGEMIEEGFIGSAIRFRDSPLLKQLGYEHPVDVFMAMKSGEFTEKVRALGYPQFSLYLVYDPSLFVFSRKTTAVYTADPLRCVVIEEIFLPRGREEPVVIDRKVNECGQSVLFVNIIWKSWGVYWVI